MKNLK